MRLSDLLRGSPAAVLMGTQGAKTTAQNFLTGRMNEICSAVRRGAPTEVQLHLGKDPESHSTCYDIEPIEGTGMSSMRVSHTLSSILVEIVFAGAPRSKQCKGP
jgi:hypothetical protein